MKVLFLHTNFPAQYRHMAAILAADPNNQIVFGTSAEKGAIKGVEKFIFQPHRDVAEGSHPYIKPLEKAVLNGQACFRMCMQLRERGFYPDVVCHHSGWGAGQYVKDAFPKAAQISYFEWYYSADGADSNFLPGEPLNDDERLIIRSRNAPILMDLSACERGLSPTFWQQQQFPHWMRNRISVLHDGVDTDYFAPKVGVGLKLGDIDLPAGSELISYVARGMEPYRGFPNFMALVEQLHKRRPNLHAVIVGADRVAYGRSLPNGQTYKEKMLAEHQFDMTRLHFTGLLPYDQYLQVLQASRVHVYLTVPFVLSWSMIEAMSAGCLVLGSDTPPVREVINDGENGLLTDFFDIDRLADRVEEVLDHKDQMSQLRRAARHTVLDRYALRELLPQHIRLIKDYV